MNRRVLTGLAGAGSALLLLAAWGFQHVGGLAPCTLCIWQRWPHGAALVVGVIGLAVSGPIWDPIVGRILAALGALAALTTAGIGFFHMGVEQKWWPGPSTCSGRPIGDLSPEDLLNQIMAAPMVRCDEIPWQMFGLSMAGWNGVVSLGLAALWIAALLHRA